MTSEADESFDSKIISIRDFVYNLFNNIKKMFAKNMRMLVGFSAGARRSVNPNFMVMSSY